MSFIKTGDAQPIIGIIKTDDELEEKRKKALLQGQQPAKKIEEDGNKIESSTESNNN